MNKIITAGCMAVATFAAVAVPTKTELERAKPVVENMTKADLAAYKAGEKTAQKVALAHLVLAQKSENPAEKYLLLQGAFKLYARCGEYDLAADAIQIMKRDIKDIPPEVIAEIVGDELRYVSDDKAPRLVAMLKEAKGAANARVVKPQAVLGPTQRRVAKLFPGWTLDTPVAHEAMNDESSRNFYSSHRGLNNVMCVHPLNETTPAVLSRTVMLSDKNPCLLLKVSSWAEKIQGGDCDFLLSVRVNGKDVVSKRRICTPDSAPWEDVTVPLSAWRGKSAKIEVILIANGWWHEFPMLARLEVGEGTVRPRLRASLLNRRNNAKDTESLQVTADGYTWSYRVDNGEATIEAKKDGRFACAVTPNPDGDVEIPSVLNGVRVTSVGREAFCHYCGPKSVKIPEGVKSIGWCAFYRCTNLASVTLPKGLNSIGHGAFAGCNKMTSVVIPESVTNIAADAFRFCEGLKSVNIPSGVRHLNACVFDACIHLDTITIPEGLESIGPQVFYNCWGLKAVTIPSKVRVIGPVAFNRCHGLRSMTIGSGVQEIGEAAFEFCGGLTEVTMLGERPNAPKDIFKGCDRLAEIHVPANAKSWAGMTEWQGKRLVFDAEVGK